MMWGSKQADQEGEKLALDDVPVPSVADNVSVSSLTQKASDRKSTRLNSSHVSESRMPSSA